jgi:hypothetical protein
MRNIHAIIKAIDPEMDYGDTDHDVMQYAGCV